MKSNHLSLLLAITTLSFATAPSAYAHSVWIEPNASQQLVVRFGEFADKKHESSPGALDRLGPITAWSAPAATYAKPAFFAVDKKSDHFLLVSAQPSQIALGETTFPVMAHGGKPAGKPCFYLRWLPSVQPAAAALTLDLTPTEIPARFLLTFRGQPLSHAVVKLHASGYAEDKEPQFTSDASGFITFSPPKPGLVLLTCNHKEALPGFSAGAAYATTSHTVALTYMAR